jgi:hypothetical protein
MPNVLEPTEAWDAAEEQIDHWVEEKDNAWRRRG